MPENQPFDLSRFITAQGPTYAGALAELKMGRKRTHWMWFVFPQIEGLGHSEMAYRYAIKSRAEAEAYLAHPVLGARLRECAEALMAVEGRSASDIFGFPADKKLQSSLTLFAQADGPDTVFARVLEKYFGGQRDGATLRWLGKPSNLPGAEPTG